MALFQKADLDKTKYIVAIVGDIKAGKKIKVKNGKRFESLVFDYNDTIKAIEKIQTEPNKYKKVLYPSSKYAPVFVTKNGSFQFNQIDKAPYSGIGGSRNSLGKALADAGELATVASLTTDIKTAKDTRQKLFIDNPDAFAAWLPTFEHTKVAVKDIVGNLGSFDILHDATDTSPFAKAITAFCKKVKIAKDSWNPADIFIIRSNQKLKISEELQTIVDNFDVKDGLVDMFNNKIYEFYKAKNLYPISLKQLVGKPKVEYANEPGKVKIAHYNIEIGNFNLNLGPDGKEIGVFTFKNTDTGKNISLQVRGFPHGYGIAQTEITSDGSPTGGRLGKISTGIVDRVLGEYNFERIKSINYFGRSSDIFSNLDDREIKEIYSWYTHSKKHSKVKDQKPITFDEFNQLIQDAKNDVDLAANLCMKIQGLKMMYFFVKHESELSNIMNKKINGAKKISTDNGFFIKIY